MTSTGIVFTIGIFLSQLKEKYLIYLLIIASLFQAASAINFNNTGVPIYSFVQILVLSIFIFKQVFYTKNPLKYQVSHEEKIIYSLLALFYFIAVLGALNLPIMFNGLPVFNPKFGIDAQYGIGNQIALTFSISNIAQVIYLSLNVMTFFIIVNYAKKANFKEIKKLLLTLVYIASFFAFYQVLSFTVFDSSFIDNFLYNNPSYFIGNEQQYSLFHRINGTFLEPSLAGSFFAAFSASFFTIHKYYKSEFILFFVTLFFLLLSTSSNGYVTLTLTLLFIYTIKFFYMISQKKHLVSISNLKLIAFILILFLFIFIIFSDKIIAVLNFVIMSKGDSDSFLHRMFADKYAFDVLFQTYGLGTGLGSNRPSSFIPYLFSNTGVVGTLLFLSFVLAIFKYSIKYISNNNILFLFTLTMSIFISMIIAIPDISYSYLWIFLALLFGTTLKINRDFSSILKGEI